jgi:hypothetical protein
MKRKAKRIDGGERLLLTERRRRKLKSGGEE